MPERLTNLYFFSLWLIVVISVNKGLNFIVFACISLILLALPKYYNLKIRGSALYLILSIFGISVVAVFVNSSQVDFSNNDIYNLIFYTLFFSTILMATNLSVSIISRASAVLIYLFFAIYSMQLLYWLVAGQIFDVNKVIFGQESRQNPAFWNFPRFSTFYEEASTFGSVLVSLAFVVQLSMPWHRTVYLSLFLALLTFSYFVYFSLIVISLISISVVVFRWMSPKTMSLTMCAFVVVSALIYHSINLDWVSFQNTSTNVVIRLSLLEYVFKRESVDILLGSGLFGEDHTLGYFTNPLIEFERIASTNDLGTIVYFFSEFGYFGVAALFLTIISVSSRLRMNNIPFLWGFLFTKISILHPLFFIIFLQPIITYQRNEGILRQGSNEVFKIKVSEALRRRK